MAWSEANISTLRSLNQGAIEQFVDAPQAFGLGKTPARDRVMSPINVVEFAWVDFAANGKYELVVVFNTGGPAQGVDVFRQIEPGKIAYQTIEPENYGYYDGPLADAIRDLNGDGKTELLVNAGFGTGRTNGQTPLTQWPQVYRLEDGQLVEASREFPAFYDEQVLPPIEAKISALQKQLDSEAEALTSGQAVMKEYSWIVPDVERHSSPEQVRAVEDSEQLALLQALRDHIVNALGRKLTAHQLAEAHEWVKSPDLLLVGDAEITFLDTGGHDAEVHEAEQAQSLMLDSFSRAMKKRQRPVPKELPRAAN